MNELILAFNAAGVRYLLAGGQAMRLAGMPRFSMDWDFFIPPHGFAVAEDIVHAAHVRPMRVRLVNHTR